MRTERLRGLLERLLPDGLTDGQLLARFLDTREEAAFAAIVRRHGPMVLGVCRRLLGNLHDAEDAFQATFLVLARKAASVARREAVGAFLYGVAYRTALRAREKASRRRALEVQVDVMPHPEVPPAEPQDWRPVLDRELNLLPKMYRAVLVLCDLEGKTRREAARVLGVPEGTVASRLATARQMLAKRLTRCGVMLSGGALAMALAGGAAAAVPAPLAAATVKAAALVAAGQAAAGTPAVALMNEVLRSMLMAKLKGYAVAALVAALIGAGGVAYRAAGQVPTDPATGAGRPVNPPPAPGSRPLTELEMLRREVDILKARVELLEERQRAQEADRRAPRGRGGMGMPGMAPGTMGPGGPPGMAPGGFPGGRGAPQGPGGPMGMGAARPGAPAPGGSLSDPTAESPAAAGAAPGARPEASRPQESPSAPRPAAGSAAASARPPARGATPDEELDAAVKAIREARDEDARRRAVDALEKALQRLRQERRPPANGTVPR
jgi:RNA polymerase sigma factor (sigma-70 family)